MAAIFDPNVLNEVVQGVLGKPLEEMIREIALELERRYPGHINTNPEWVLNNAGGAMGQMAILHASITEYVIIFGSPIGTEGHTGRFWADDWFFILDGEQWSYSPGSLDREVYKPGDMHKLDGGKAQGYRIPERCYALEYARGIIPTMLPFGLADTVFSTLDARTMLKTFRLYGKAVVSELAQGKV